ncbi:MAG: hypothetical protein LAT78_13220, partial [Roseinatronobacter sp.]|nr:hypothetical protein [Roseinatronobacter sp.]
MFLRQMAFWYGYKKLKLLPLLAFILSVFALLPANQARAEAITPVTFVLEQSSNRNETINANNTATNVGKLAVRGSTIIDSVTFTIGTQNQDDRGDYGDLIIQLAPEGSTTGSTIILVDTPRLGSWGTSSTQTVTTAAQTVTIPAGTYDIQFIKTGGKLFSTRTAATQTLGSFPELTFGLLPDTLSLTVGTPSPTVTATTTGGSGRFSYSVEPALPAGLSLDSTGAIPGTPTASAASAPYTGTVTDTETELTADA